MKNIYPTSICTKYCKNFFGIFFRKVFTLSVYNYCKSFFMRGLLHTKNKIFKVHTNYIQIKNNYFRSFKFVIKSSTEYWASRTNNSVYKAQDDFYYRFSLVLERGRL